MMENNKFLLKGSVSLYYDGKYAGSRELKSLPLYKITKESILRTIKGNKLFKYIQEDTYFHLYKINNNIEKYIGYVKLNKIDVLEIVLN